MRPLFLALLLATPAAQAAYCPGLEGCLAMAKDSIAKYKAAKTADERAKAERSFALAHNELYNLYTSEQAKATREGEAARALRSRDEALRNAENTEGKVNKVPRTQRAGAPLPAVGPAANTQVVIAPPRDLSAMLGSINTVVNAMKVAKEDA